MSGQKPDNRWLTVAKLVGVCITCFGVVYGLVTLVNALSS